MAPWGVTLLAVLPLVLLAAAEVALWGWREYTRAHPFGAENYIVYLPIIFVATLNLRREMPAWALLWAAVGLWGMVELLRAVALGVLGTYWTREAGEVASWGLLVVGTVAALGYTRYLAQQRVAAALLFLGAYLLAGPMGGPMAVLSFGQPALRIVVWGLVLTGVQVVVAVLVLRMALTEWRPALGLWVLVPLLFPLAALAMAGATGLRVMGPQDVALAWWPVQAAALLVTVVLLRAKGARNRGPSLLTP